MSEDAEGTFDDCLISLEKVQCAVPAVWPGRQLQRQPEKVRPTLVAPRLVKLREQSTQG
ncbi:MAG: hypothetical protein C0622_02325 [Desulfuromonas sp.]|nr:MAG: hypothetical protein C0622_02325 [Desulfuromonas sp.]